MANKTKNQRNIACDTKAIEACARFMRVTPERMQRCFVRNAQMALESAMAKKTEVEKALAERRVGVTAGMLEKCEIAVEAAKGEFAYWSASQSNKSSATGI